MAEDIRTLIAHGENQTVEFKTSLRLRREIGQTISAFANTDGGVLLVGVSDEGKVAAGNEIGKKTLEDLANWAKENTDPEIYPTLTVHQIDNQNIIEVAIKGSNEKPVFFGDRVFQRVGKTNQRISAGKIRELAKQEQERLHWDQRICEGATLEDIDAQKVTQFIKEANEKRNLSISEKSPIKTVLRKLGLLKTDNLTRAAILLFGKAPQAFYSQAEVRCARFKGTKPLEFIDMKVFAGDILAQINQVEDFVKAHIALHAKIEGMRRREQWEYPIEAVREAIVNAITHRDYESAGNVQIRIFDDRIEVRNPGGLPEGLTVEELKRDHDSFPRNPSIADCFFLVKLIERWGTGTNRMISLCLSQGLPEPEFEDRKISFIVRFHKFFITEEIVQQLNDRQKGAIEHLKDAQRITTGEYVRMFGISDRTARRDMKQMTDLGILEKTGTSDKTTYYVFSGHLADI